MLIMNDMSIRTIITAKLLLELRVNFQTVMETVFQPFFLPQTSESNTNEL